MMAAESSCKKDGLCSLTAQKLIEEHTISGPTARNHPGYSADDFSEPEPIQPHRVKVPYPDDLNLKRLHQDLKITQKGGVQLKNNEYGKIWTNIHNKRSNDDTSKTMDEDLATKLKERSKKVDEEEHLDDVPIPPEFAQVQLRKTGSRELLNIE